MFFYVAVVFLRWDRGRAYLGIDAGRDVEGLCLGCAVGAAG